VRFVDGPEVRIEGVEIIERSQKVMLNQVLVALEEGWAKAIGSRDGIVLHGEKGRSVFHPE
jgi:hypothetical protein